ncbi:hypothetical protein GIB64_26955 [Pseudomonas lactis]|jgi:hypothetical protein|uniref:Uncharacterized protein n=1 Tax=Pseudomonas hygromyciniae TaxID=2812000 RepID=A0ABX7JY03_9PSED|nr:MULTISPECIES: hypothetical protein [Pseudomonas]MBA5961075.1 hypothetical protein [Pseudomonas lactis]MBN0976542.1 hypothetical protein [Pseudomonas hygromyciniae]MCQ9186163.1 hypothetical protein [Streptomyces hayashii]QSB39322.1 hypothetical protein JTY93_24745 [Pseudomonas hygromyciniae]
MMLSTISEIDEVVVDLTVSTYWDRLCPEQHAYGFHYPCSKNAGGLAVDVFSGAGAPAESGILIQGCAEEQCERFDAVNWHTSDASDTAR